MTIHFIGIGGIGMSALARYFVSQKWSVSGSDLEASKMTHELKKDGIRVNIGHHTANISKKIDLVVYNRAIRADNPELLAARALGLKILPYAEVLGELTERYKTIAITGSHGKSTTTALTGLVLTHTGLDPTVLIGTQLKEFGGKNIRIRKSEYLVLEADDFDKAFLHYSPTIAVITNIDREHVDTYKNISDAKKSFLEFLSRTNTNGVFILNKDDKNLFSLKSRVGQIAKSRHIKVIWYSLKQSEAAKIKKIIRISGRHNISNALASYNIGRALNIPELKILSAISKYHGAWRRMEYRGELRIMNNESRVGSSSLFQNKPIIHNSSFVIPVYDDYAHHPTEIKATLQAFKEKFPAKKIICVYQPHQTQRLRVLFKEFRDAFTDADVLILLDIYRVPGRDREKATSDKRQATSKNSEDLCLAIKKKYPKKEVLYLKNPNNLKKTLLLFSSYYFLDSILIMMGAGDINKYTDQLLKT